MDGVDWRNAVLQVSLAKPVIALIGKNYHERQVNMRPNVVQVRPGDATHCYPALCTFCSRTDQSLKTVTS